MGLRGNLQGEGATVGGDLAVDRMSGAGVAETTQVGDAGLFGGVVLSFVRSDVFVDLVDGFEVGAAIERGQGSAAGAFGGSIVHDRDRRCQ